MPAATLNPNHHLWRNGRLWWIAFTVVYDGWRQERVRRSLGTLDTDEARRRRDALLQQYAAIPNAEVVAFRSSSSSRDVPSAHVGTLGATDSAFRLEQPALSA